MTWQVGASACWLAATLAGQAPANLAIPRLHAAIAASEHRQGVPAIAWLCDEFLPSLPQWPEGLDPSGALSLSLSLTELQIRETNVSVPAGAAAIGTFSFSDASSAPQVDWRCDTNGREQWFVPGGFELPDHWQRVLRSIEGDLLSTSRTLSVAVITGHFAGAMIDNGPRSALLRLGASACGDATWCTERHGDELQVTGRSDGGLMLPMTLLALAVGEGSSEPHRLALRAFAARDADQAEATRQLGRTDRALDSRTLRAMLHAEDEVRLTAVEALVRHVASNELPAIIRAADAEHPWATIAARDAVTRLWPFATPQERLAARTALQASDVPALREIDLTKLASTPAGTMTLPISPESTTAPVADGSRARALILLFCGAIGLLGLWQRERARQLATTN